MLVAAVINIHQRSDVPRGASLDAEEEVEDEADEEVFS